MTTNDMPPSGGNGNGALVPTDINGEPRIRDLDLAAWLGFAQARDIRKIIARHHGALSALGPVAEVEEVVGKGQRVTAAYLNRKQAIFITAKSETPEATEITIEIIERFDAYERGAAKPAVDPMQVLNDPAAMRGLLLTYTEKVIALEAKVQEQAPAVAVHDRIANAEGSCNLTLAAKELEVPPHAFTKWCDTNGWTYKRGNQRLAYQDKINAGYLEMKTDTIRRPDGTDKAVYQVFVTPKGLTRLAKIFNETPLGSPPRLAPTKSNGTKYQPGLGI